SFPPFLLCESAYSALGLLAPPFRSEAERDERLHHAKRALELATTLQEPRERQRQLRAKGVVAVVVRAFVARERGVDLARALEAARESERRGRVVGCAAGSRGRDRASHAIGDPHEGDHVARVVLEDRRDDGRIAFAQIVEVRVGNEPTGYVRGPTVIEDALLQLPQRRGPESVAPEPSRRVQEVEVRVVHGDLAAYGHDEARADDREVERLAVVGRARAERLDLLFELFDEFSLRTEIEKHVLPQDQLPAGEVSDADQEDVRARPARE